MNFNKDQVIDGGTDLIGLAGEGIYIEYEPNQNDSVNDINDTNNGYEQIVQRYASNQGAGHNSITTVSGKKMWQLGKHYNKHGKLMGYQSAADYDAAAKDFARKMQNDPNTKIFEGQWNGKGRLNNTTQRAITNNNKTVIIDAGTGQVIDFYMGNTYGGLINLNQIK